VLFESRPRRGRRALRRGSAALAASLPLAGLLAACGGDDDDDDDGADAATSTPAAASTNTAGSSAAATNTPADTPATATTGTSATATGSAAGGFSFTDDRRKDVTLPEVPERIVAQVGAAASLWDFGVRPIGVFGPLLKADGSLEPNAGSIDPDAVESVGDSFDNFDVEKLLSLDADLLVSTMYAPDDLWNIQEEAEPQVNEITPTIGISLAGLPVTTVIGRFEELATALGADVSAPEVAEGRARFDAASEAVKAAVAANPGLSVLFLSGSQDFLYIANPPDYGDLLYFQELGVEIVEPGMEAGAYWEELSWEQATKHPADLVLSDARGYSFTIEQLKGVPTMAEHPAFKADQVGLWRTEYVNSYASFAVVLEELAESIANARADVV
jgi:iron complex transport system substrate-binding protein